MIGAKMKIEAADTEIAKLLRAGFLVIPRFQRPYSWRTEHLRDFWNDLVENEEGNYFIGSMVIYAMGRDRFGVVDGQQRLTTITILLCVIRDLLNSLDAVELAKGVHNYVETADRDNVKSFVLKTETSFPYLPEMIQKFGRPELDVLPGEEEKRLQFAYEYFRRQALDYLKWISREAADKRAMRDLRIDALKKLRDIVIQLKVIKIELDNEEDAHIIFETLNTRGQDLTLSDLIKNSLGALVSKAGDVDVFKEMWKNLNANLTNCGAASKTDSFFLHSWSSRFTPVTKQKAFRAFKKRISEEMTHLQADERTVGLSHLSAFKDDSRRYLTISAPEGNWKKFENIVEDALLALRLFNVEQQTPFVLSLLRAYDEKKVSYKMLRRALCSVENFHFQFNAITSSRSSGSIASMYSRFAKGLYEAPDRTTSALIIDDAINELRGRLPSIEEFTVSFKQLSYNTLNRSNALLRYVLLKLAKVEMLSHDVDSTLLTIEHIRSQSAVDDQWKEDKINGIGNLFLLSEARNLKVQNKEFLAKKVLFQSWHQSIPAYILEQDDWTPELSEQRAANMADTAYRQVWSI